MITRRNSIVAVTSGLPGYTKVRDSDETECCTRTRDERPRIGLLGARINAISRGGIYASVKRMSNGYGGTGSRYSPSWKVSIRAVPEARPGIARQVQPASRFLFFGHTFCPDLGDLGACAYIVERAPHPDGFTGRVRGYEMLTIIEKPADLTQVFPYQKSHCAVNFTVRAVITPNGLSQFPVGL